MNKKIAITGVLSFLLICIFVFLYQQYSSIPRFEEISVVRNDIRVLDGDTIVWKGERVRLLGYDTPELGNSDYYNGDQEPWASQARNILISLIDNSSSLSLLFASDNDKYGRYLGHLLIDGTPSGIYLILAGYAYPTIDRYGDNGFPDEAEQIVEAAAKSTPHPFENPRVWRRTNSKHIRDD